MATIEEEKELAQTESRKYETDSIYVERPIVKEPTHAQLEDWLRCADTKFDVDRDLEMVDQETAVIMAVKRIKEWFFPLTWGKGLSMSFCSGQAFPVRYDGGSAATVVFRVTIPEAASSPRKRQIVDQITDMLAGKTEGFSITCYALGTGFAKYFSDDSTGGPTIDLTATVSLPGVVVFDDLNYISQAVQCGAIPKIEKVSESGRHFQDFAVTARRVPFSMLDRIKSDQAAESTTPVSETTV